MAASAAENQSPTQDPAALDPEAVKSRLRTSYNTIAPRYNEWTTPHSQQRMAFLNRLLQDYPPPLLMSSPPSPSSSSSEEQQPHILELGCGCGLPVLKHLLTTYPNLRVTGNDLSDKQLALAAENLSPFLLEEDDEEEKKKKKNSKNKRLTLTQGDMNSPSSLSFPDSSLSAVLGFYSLIHLPREEQSELLTKISRWLVPGGYFLGNFGAEETLEGGRIMERWLGEDGGWMYWSGWGREGTLREIEKVGFEVLVGEVVGDAVDADFLWVIARKKGEGEGK